jgi:hypothetical protein
MCFVGAGAILGAGVSILGSIAGFAQQNKQTWENNAYAMQQQAVQEKYRADLMEYNNEVYRSELDYRANVLDYRESEFKRQVEFVDTARNNMEQNYFVKVGTVLTRAFEEQLADTFQMVETQKEGSATRASVQAVIGERGIEGNTADLLTGDVTRQEGEALSMLELNKKRRTAQTDLDILSVKAEHDTRIGQLQIQTDSPLSPVNRPSPVAPVTQARMQSGPSSFATAVNIASSVLSGINGYRTANGMKF